MSQAFYVSAQVYTDKSIWRPVVPTERTLHQLFKGTIVEFAIVETMSAVGLIGHDDLAWDFTPGSNAIRDLTPKLNKPVDQLRLYRDVDTAIAAAVMRIAR